jgi:hypothetical protein
MYFNVFSEGYMHACKSFHVPFRYIVVTAGARTRTREAAGR